MSLPAWDKMPDWNQDLARKGSQWWNTFGSRKWLSQSLESWITWEQELKFWKHQHSMPIPSSVSSNSINFRIRISVHWRKLHFFPPDKCLQRPMRGCFCWNYLGPLALSCFHLMDLSAALFQTCEFSSQACPLHSCHMLRWHRLHPKAGLLWRGWRLAGVTHPCDLAMWLIATSVGIHVKVFDKSQLDNPIPNPPFPNANRQIFFHPIFHTKKKLSFRPFFQASAHVDPCIDWGSGGSMDLNADDDTQPTPGKWHFLMWCHIFKHILQHSAPYRLPCFQCSKNEKVLTCFQLFSCLYQDNFQSFWYGVRSLFYWKVRHKLCGRKIVDIVEGWWDDVLTVKSAVRSWIFIKATVRQKNNFQHCCW